KANGLTIGKLPQSSNKLNQFPRIGECPMMLWREDRRMRDQAPNLGNFLCIFNRRQHTSVPGLRTLRQLHFYHFHFFQRRSLSKHFRIKIPVSIPAAKITCSDLPNQITSLQMVFRNPSLTRIMIKFTTESTLVQC